MPLAVLAFALGAGAPSPPPPADLLQPLQAPPALTGSFGELRGARPHAGIDFSTFGRTGLEVRAAADGWVWKIRKSRYGYGNVVYLRTETGYHVYAHLEGFADRLEALFDGQRPDADGRLEIVPAPGRVRVRRGEVIARSGESGGVPPHLHFEVRDAAERPLNPLTHGLPVADREPPVIHSVTLEPAGPDGLVDGVPGPVTLARHRRGPVRVRLPVRVLATVSDGDGQGRGSLAPYRVRLLVDGEPVHEFRADRFSYDRQNEAGLVYDAYRTARRFVVRLHDLGGRVTPEFVATRPEDGYPSGRSILRDLAPGRHRLVVEASDAAGHATSFGLELEILAPAAPPPPPGRTATHYMDGWIGLVRDGRAETVVLAGLPEGRHEVGGIEIGLGRVDPVRGGGVVSPDGVARLVVPGHAAYRAVEVVAVADEWPDWPEIPVVAGPYAFHPLGEPFGAPVRVEFRAPDVPRPEQLGVYRLEMPRQRWVWEGAEWSAGRIGAEVRFLAPVALRRDAVPPRVEATEPAHGARVRAAPRLVATITDVGAGVDPRSVRAWMDGRPLDGWYDGGYRKWFIHESPIPPGRHDVRIVASDRAGNAIEHRFSFTVAP